jgi:hypothetical protein
MKPFLVGFAVAMTLMVLLSLIPYLLSRGSYATDGLEVAGFPFEFWRIGGAAFIREFRFDLLLADIAIALASSTVAGALLDEIYSRQKSDQRLNSASPSATLPHCKANRYTAAMRIVGIILILCGVWAIYKTVTMPGFRRDELMQYAPSVAAIVAGFWLVDRGRRSPDQTDDSQN